MNLMEFSHETSQVYRCRSRIFYKDESQLGKTPLAVLILELFALETVWSHCHNFRTNTELSNAASTE